MERISRSPTPDCPLCGWSRKDHPMGTHEWMTKTGECTGEDREPCLKRQLAAANERANRYHRDAQKMSAALTAKMETTTGHSFGRTLANVGYHAERLRRIDTEAALREANERADGAADLINKACLYAYENANTTADTEHGEGYKLGVSHMASILGGS